MYRIKSATGTTTGADEEIMALVRAQTTLAGTEDKYNPFRPKAMSISCDTDTTIDINYEGFTYLKLDSNEEYSLNLAEHDIVIKSLKIATTGTTWKLTFLF